MPITASEAWKEASASMSSDPLLLTLAFYHSSFGSPIYVVADTVDHVFKLEVRGATGIGDVVGDVLGRIGDHRHLPAQLFHVVERGRRNRGNAVELVAVAADQI